MKIQLNSNYIHEILKLSKADSISFINKEGINYIIANEQKDITFKNQILGRVFEEYYDEPGATLISKDILKLIPQYTEVTIMKDTIIAGKRKIKYAPNSSVDEPIQVENYLTTIQGKELEHLLSGYYAMATDMTRPILCGMCIQENEFAALDGFRLTVRQGNFKAKEQVVMDLNLVNTLKKVKYDKDVEIYYNDKYVKFVFEDLEVIGNRVEGEYIKYKSIIPDDHITKVEIETKPIVDVLKDYKKNKFEMVKLEFEEKKLNISANNDMAMVDDNLCINLQGEPIKIAFNLNYLIDALKNYESAALEFTSNVSPVIVKENNKLDLVLPVYIR